MFINSEKIPIYEEDFYIIFFKLTWIYYAIYSELKEYHNLICNDIDLYYHCYRNEDEYETTLHEVITNTVAIPDEVNCEYKSLIKFLYLVKGEHYGDFQGIKKFNNKNDYKFFIRKMNLVYYNYNCALHFFERLNLNLNIDNLAEIKNFYDFSIEYNGDEVLKKIQEFN